MTSDTHKLQVFGFFLCWVGAVATTFSQFELGNVTWSRVDHMVFASEQ